MATLSQFRRVVGNKVGLDYENAGDERNLIDEWCSQGVRDILLRTHCYTAVTTITTTADEWQYDLGFAAMAVKHLWREGETEKMRRVSPEELLDLHNAEGGTGTTTYWAMSGSNMVLLWPTPSEEYTINMIYVPAPTALSFESHDPSIQPYGGIPTEFHKAIELYALAEAGDYDDDQSSAGGLAYRQRYEEEIMRIRKAVVGKGGRLPPARVRRGALVPRGREDIYP